MRLFLLGSFSTLLRETVAEFTLADHKGATTTSMLQSLCHKDDSILLGAWVQDTDHRKVEEQVSDCRKFVSYLCVLFFFGGGSNI